MTYRKRLDLIIMLMLLLVLLTPFSGFAAHDGDKKLVLGVLALRPKEEMKKDWQPMAEELDRALKGYTVEIRFLEHREMMAAAQKQQLDFVITNPSHFIMIRQVSRLSGSLATVIPDEGGQPVKEFGGAIIARADRNDIKTINDLKGKRIACINAREAFGGYQVQMAELYLLGMKLPKKSQFLETGIPHDRVVDAVISGKADVGFTRTGMIEKMAAQGKLDLKQIKVLNRQNIANFPYASSTRLYPEWPFVALQHVDEDTVRKVAAIVLGMEHGSASLRSAGIHGFGIPVDYQPVETLLRELRLPPFEKAPQFTLKDVWRRYHWWMIGLAIATCLIVMQTLRLASSNYKLKTSEERFRGIAESMADWIWEVDAEGRYTYCSENVEKILGYTPEELLGKTPLDLMDEEEREKMLVEFKRIAAAAEPISNLKNWNITKDGRRVCLSSSGVPIRGRDGELKGYRGIDTDITAYLQLQEQLLHAQKLESIGRLAGGIAHDYNNKLMVILGNAELAKLELPDCKNVGERLKEIVRAANHSKDITAQLLAFSRQQITTPRPVELNKAVSETRKAVAMLIGEDIELHFNPADESWNVWIDPVQLDQIVMNMAVNARDAMPDGGVFTISTENIRLDEPAKTSHPGLERGEYVAISFSDTGCGMDQETLQKIFEPFYTTKEVGKGTGLGLSTIYGIVRQSGGSISVVSEPGKGSSFEILLPRHQGTVKPLFRDQLEYAGKGEGDILLVEDEESVRKMTSHMLQMLGYTVHEASTAEEALQIVSDSNIKLDLVVSDLIMPRINGKVLFERLLLIRPELKAVFMSGHADDILSRESIGELGENFLQKPFGYKQLYEKLEGLLAKS